jgi:thiol-disulfide isomerase/thioredoxin
MKPKLQLLLLFCMLMFTVSAQNDTSAKSKVEQNDTTLKFTDVQKDSSVILISTKKDTTTARFMGDPAPQLRVREWIKGTPVTSFEKGKVYVVDFWATWCGPCIAGMPHLSDLARKFKDKVTISSIDVFESQVSRPKTLTQIKEFVDSMGRKMNFNVAVEDTNFTVHDWLDAFHQHYIPAAFVINGQGIVVWMGNTRSLDTVLQKIVNNTWDIEAESIKRKYADNSQKYLDDLDEALISKVRRYQGRYNDLDDLGFPDSTLMVIDEMVKKEPKLKYSPWVASYTFIALLRTDPHKAYEFGKQTMASSPYGGDAYGSIIGDIRDDMRKLSTPKEIYLLGAECYQVKIDRSPPYVTIDYMAKQYHEMAEWYRRGGDKLKALAAEKKAIKLWEKQAKK